MIRTPDEVQEKLELLKALGDIQAAMTFINSDLDSDLHPADRHYRGLQCDIKPLLAKDEMHKVGYYAVTLPFVSRRCILLLAWTFIIYPQIRSAL